MGSSSDVLHTPVSSASFLLSIWYDGLARLDLCRRPAGAEWVIHLGLRLHTLPCEREYLHLTSGQVVGIRHSCDDILVVGGRDMCARWCVRVVGIEADVVECWEEGRVVKLRIPFTLSQGRLERANTCAKLSIIEH